MSDDLIRKSDVLETYADLYDIFDDNKAIQEELHKVFDKINDIPAVEPKRGKWIWDNDAVDWNLGAWICSNCHARNDNIPHSERIIPLRWSGSNFCPNCGADMRKGTDDE